MEDPMNRRTMLRFGAATALAALAGEVWAQSKLVLKAPAVHPLGYPTVEAVLAMGKKLEATTAGRISVQMYPSMQLGGEKEMIEQAQVGALAIARISVGPMGPLVDDRSEEHTSELQSQSNLVCRLLLEKKKKNTIKQRNTKYS